MGAQLLQDSYNAVEDTDDHIEAWRNNWLYDVIHEHRQKGAQFGYAGEVQN
jgi:hypothetical protein